MPKPTSKKAEQPKQAAQPKNEAAAVETAQPAPAQSPKPEGKVYTVPGNERDLYHVLMDRKEYNPATGKPIFKPFVQKYDPKIWKSIHDVLVAQGYVMTIIYDPTKQK